VTGPLSVGFINTFGGSTLGGGEVQLLALMRGLCEEGVRLRLACAPGSALAAAATEISCVRVTEIDFEASMPRVLSRMAARGLKGSDVVHGTGFLTNLVARRVGHILRVPVINGVHVMPDAARLDGRSWLEGIARSALDRSSRSRVDRFVSVSQAVASALIVEGVERDRIAVVPNGIDTAAFRAAAARPLDLRLPPAPRRVGYVGRLERVKGCEHFVEAASLVGARDPGVRFVVAGAGSLEATLLDAAALGTVADRIDFLGHLHDVAPLYPLLDVVCVPSLSEAFGLSAIEALALGVPVVASAVGGLPEVVQHGATGLLVPPAHPQALASAVLELLGDPGQARAMGVAGQRQVGEAFTVEAMVRGYLRVYEDVLGAAPASSPAPPSAAE
jgi:glycosyltransferase involved in cell wall biosynthesis